MAIRDEQKVQIDTGRVVPNEFINHQVDKLAALEDEERFHFSKFTSVSQVRIAVKAFYH